MLLKIKLAEPDRARYSLPEWIDLDIDRPMLSDVKCLKLEVGLSWLDMRNGVLAGDLYSCGAAFFVAARRAGMSVSWDEFDVDVNAVLATEVVPDDPNSSAPDGAPKTSTP
jgi:hypothetical protein